MDVCVCVFFSIQFNSLQLNSWWSLILEVSVIIIAVRFDDGLSLVIYGYYWWIYLHVIVSSGSIFFEGLCLKNEIQKKKENLEKMFQFCW